MKLSDYFAGRLRAGEPDFENLKETRFARVQFDGSTWFYDLPEGTSLEEFKIAAQVAWGRDCDYAEIWGSDGYAIVAFD